MKMDERDSDLEQYEESADMATTTLRSGESLEIVDDAGDEGSEMEATEPNQEDLQIFEDDSVQGFFSHTEAVYSVACSPTDPTDVITGGGDDYAYRWSLSTGEQHPVSLSKHNDSVISVGYSHDGTMFATAGMDGIVRVFSNDSSNLLHTLEGPATEIEWMSWHPKGPVLAAGCSDGTCWVWHVSASGANVVQVLSQDSSQTCGEFTGLEGKTLCTGSEDGTLRVWSVKTGQPITVIKAGPLYHQAPIVSLHSHPTQPIVLTGSQDNTAKWVHIETGRILGSITEHRAPVEAVAFPAAQLGHNWAATGSMDGAIFIIDLDRGAVRVRLSQSDGIVKLKWLRNRPYLLCSCSLDGSIKLWDSRTGDCVQEFRGHTGPVYDIAISADEKFIVSASDDHTALVFAINQ